MKRNIILLAFLIAVAAIIAGCGGGGGGSAPPSNNNFVLTGKVEDRETGEAIVGAKVKVSTYEVLTNSQGRFTLSMPSRPLATTYSVDGTNAGPYTEGYHTNAAIADGEMQDALAIALPIAPATGMDLGTIYLWSKLYPPPPFF